MLIFSFGLFAPRNATVIAALFAAALSVLVRFYLMLEIYFALQRTDSDLELPSALRAREPILML
jgi:hypothetical protein